VIYALFALSLPIALADLKFHKIPNIYLWLLTIFLIPNLVVNGFGDLKVLFILLFSTILFHLLGMGMGDLKLLVVIGVWLNSAGVSGFPNFGLLILFCLMIHFMLVSLYKRRLARYIPMAPSIFIGLGLYLASRWGSYLSQ
jgi:Flp pilus assembly protein protease CpaA